ncbi:hypothetical protein V0288_15905 [Pannus brasiliensis CCIBt3594]|uniref:Glycosyltransferase RgtA/B/C/D-like domain-containing protein n=1 Tax=Pannus brasiliensis CCIBt3594 TaxID=1427578 RepID=A0AAW9QLE7_9CHRO
MKKVTLFPLLFAIALSGYLLLVMTVNLSSFPGLHADEAWVGLNANSIIYNGTRTIHGVNTYTSSFYSWLVSLGFRGAGVHLFTLRFVGVFLNFLGFLIVLGSFYKYIDKKSIFIYLALLISGSSLLLFPRIAWEVCALQGFFLSIKFSILLKHLKGYRLEFIDVFLFLTITSIGTINHFIFIFESLGLALAALLLHLRYCNKNTIELLYLSVLSSGWVAIIYLVKPSIADEFFQEYRYALLITTLVILVTIDLFFLKTRFQIVHGLDSINSKYLKLLYGIACLFSLGVLGFLGGKFFAGHSWSFFGTISGIVVIERLSSYLLTAVESRWLEIVWGGLIAIFIIRGFQKLANKLDADKLQMDVFCYLYTLSCLLFISLSPGNSDRYYIIPIYLFVASFPLVVRNHRVNSRSRYCWGALILWLGLTLSVEQSLLWRNILSTDNRPPVLVTYHNYRDYSSHFLKHHELLQFLRKRKICHIDRNTSYFIYFPLDFHFLTDRFPCDPAPTVRIEHCPHCWGEPKYFKVIKSPG